MRQKLESFKKQIRRKEIQQYFLQKRNGISNQLQPKQKTFIINQQNHPRQLCNNYLEETYVLEGNSQILNMTEIDVYEIWKIDLTNIQNYLIIGSYDKIVPIMNEIYNTLKKITNPNGCLYNKQSEIYNYFLRTSLLANMVKCILLAHKQKVAVGLFQSLSNKMIDILQIAIRQEPKQFTQSVFFQSNLLLLLRLCIDQPKLDKSHLSKIMNIIVHMICVSNQSTGKLFTYLNTMNNQTFNLSAPFYSISKLPVNPTQNITVSFIMMMKFYLERIEDSRRQAKIKKNKTLQIKVNLTSYQLDISAQIAINSYHYFINRDLSFLANQKEDLINLQQSIELIRLQIQLQIMNRKFIDIIDYAKMIHILTIKNFSSKIKEAILSMIDHLIYRDEDDKYSFGFVKNCDLLSNLWTLRKDYLGYVLNIFSNLAYSSQFKSDLSPFVHSIFLSLKFDANNILYYNFIYNWFSSQQFQILQSRDKLILQLLRQSTQTNPQITDIESLLWLKLVEKGQCNVPLRILNMENDSVRYIKQHLIRIDYAL